MIILAFAIMYFFMIRPQRKRQKEIENFRNSLQVGQEVVTSGGLYGKIKQVEDNIVNVEIAHNVVIRVDKSAVYANPSAANQQ
ncbi:MAG: preprotein translocase subunit YajC [Bacteroidaceae bacterium]|nr:preprotein translocase subunit YajC [Bacteroidaceae bacterium]